MNMMSDIIVTEKILVECQVCGVEIRQDRLDKHMKKVHIKYADSKIPSSKIILKSRRGTRIRGGEQQCSECGYPDKVLWKYAKSNFGMVYLCWSCKAKVFDRSFGKIDATEMAYSGNYGDSIHRN